LTPDYVVKKKTGHGVSSTWVCPGSLIDCVTLVRFFFEPLELIEVYNIPFFFFFFSDTGD
jgi:hypothetical protein